ncbi:MAG: hypothetical protein LUH53_01475 [Lachnospiraceae bacterium]|nr:hypothetical protein [Lachnospiraceae bacterium]
MRKTTKRNRILAFILTFAMIFQQAGITTFADEGTSAAAETAVEATTNDAGETTAAEEVSTADETTAQTTASTEAEEVSVTDTEASADPADTDEPDAEASDNDTDPAAETIVDVEDESEADTESAAEDVTEAESEEVTEAATEAAEDTEATDAAEAADETETEAETEEEAPKTSFTYSDENVVITATASEDANFSQDVELVADYIEPDSIAYEEAVSKIESQLGSSLGLTDDNTEAAYLLYDVYFLSAEGERVEPEAGTVSVSMVFRQAVDLGLTGEITSKAVVHIKDGSTAEVVTDFVNVNANGDVTAMGFTQDSFSETGLVLASGSTDVPFDISSAVDMSQFATINVNSVYADGEDVATSIVERDAELTINMTFTVGNDTVSQTLAHSSYVWEYDLSDFVDENCIFSVSGSGDLYRTEGTSTKVGEYYVENGKLYLYIYEQYLDT